MISKSEDASRQQNRQLTVATTLTITTNFIIGIQGITIMKGELKVYKSHLKIIDNE